MNAIVEVTFCGRRFTAQEVELMRVVARDYAGLGVTEIARTICELLEWTRPNGGLKNHECRQLLERLAAEGMLTLPALRNLGGRGLRRVNLSQQHSEPEPVECAARECEPLELVLVEGEGESRGESRRWREHVERYHYLGCRVPFGANLRYWVRNRGRELACLLWTSPAWKMQARDAWIGWNDEQRKRNLQWIVNNGRFLILPWVRVKDLASKILALSPANAARLASPIWVSSPAAGNAGRHAALSRNLLPGSQLAPCWADRRARTHGSGTPEPRSGRQRYLRVSGSRCQGTPTRRSDPVNKYLFSM
jgi:hypothetical protein